MSKELEALEQLSKLVFVYGGVEQYRLIEKALKALEIIKEKRVDIYHIQATYKVSEYNFWKLPTSKRLTKQEYDLLKEVLL